MGLEEERLKLSYCSAAEGQKFQREATEFDKVIRTLGPSPFKSKGDTPQKVKTQN
jgi:F420-non-reducing hydrogenase iron-sulfur subunit